MPIIQNEALRNQIMKVAQGQRQRGIDEKARAAAMGQMVGDTIGGFTKVYQGNAKEVLAQAKELGLNSPEEIAGLQRVHDLAEESGMSVDEILGSPDIMADLMSQAQTLTGEERATQKAIMENKWKLAREEGELETVQGYLGPAMEGMAEGRAKMDSAEKNMAELQPLRSDFEGKLSLPLDLQEEKYAQGEQQKFDNAAMRQEVSGDIKNIRSTMGKTRARGTELAGESEGTLTDRRAKMKEFSSRRAALAKMGIAVGTPEGKAEIARLKKAYAKGKQLDELASKNLVGRDMIGRQASAGMREGQKEAAAQALAKMTTQHNINKDTRAGTKSEQGTAKSIRDADKDRYTKGQRSKVSHAKGVKHLTDFASNVINFTSIEDLQDDGLVRQYTDTLYLEAENQGIATPRIDALVNTIITGRQKDAINNLLEIESDMGHRQALIGLQKKNLAQRGVIAENREKGQQRRQDENIEAKKTAAELVTSGKKKAAFAKPAVTPNLITGGKKGALTKPQEEKLKKDKKKEMVGELEASMDRIKGHIRLPQQVKNLRGSALAEWIVSKFANDTTDKNTVDMTGGTGLSQQIIRDAQAYLDEVTPARSGAGATGENKKATIEQKKKVFSKEGAKKADWKK